MGFFERLFGSNDQSKDGSEQRVTIGSGFELVGRRLAEDCLQNGLEKGEIVRLAEIEKTIANNYRNNSVIVQNGFLERMLQSVRLGEVLNIKEEGGDTVFVHSRYAKDILAEKRVAAEPSRTQTTLKSRASTPLGKAYELYLSSEAETLGKKFFGTLITKTADGKFHVKYNEAGNLLDAVRLLAIDANEILLPGSAALCQTDGGRKMIDSCIATAFTEGADEKIRRPSAKDLELLITYAVTLVTKNLSETVAEMRPS